MLCGQDVLSCSAPPATVTVVHCPMLFVLSPHSAYSLLSPALLILTALPLRDDAITTQNVQTDREYCMQSVRGAERRVWELLLGQARFMRSSVVVLVGTVCSQPPAAGMLNPQILCCTIVAFLSPKGNVRLQTCYLQLIYLLSIARV